VKISKSFLLIRKAEYHGLARGCLLLEGILIASLIFFGCGQETIANENSINFPERGIEVVVPYGPGGLSDLSCRVFTNAWSQILKTKIMVINKPGGGAMIGPEYVVSSKPDGYTLGFTAGRPAFPEIFAKTIPYRAEDLKQLFMVIFGIPALVVRPEAPWADTHEFIAYAKDNPGTQYSSTGKGASPHLFVEALADYAGIILEDIPYGGDADSLLALLSGDVDIAVLNFPAAVAQYEAGKVRILGIHSPERMKAIPEVPTFIEQGLDIPLGILTFIGISAPAGIPEEVENILIETGKQAATDPKTIAQLEELGFYAHFSSGDEYKVILDEYKEIVGKFMKKLGLYQE